MSGQAVSYSDKAAAVRASVNALASERDAFKRQQEILTDISFHVGMVWRSISEQVREQIIEELDGSRGLVNIIIQWAGEFDAFWEALPEYDERRENYISEVDNFANEKFSALVAEIRLGG